MSRHVFWGKKNNPNNMSVQKIEGGLGTEPSRAGRMDEWRRDTDLAWCRSSLFPQKWGAPWGPNPFERLNYLNPSPFLFLFDVG